MIAHPLLRAGGVLALAAMASGCQETVFTDIQWTDIWRQNRRNATDVLVVVDNSCSMVEEQGNLARNFGALIDTFSDAEIDWRIAVTTTDPTDALGRPGRTPPGWLVGGDDEILLDSPPSESGDRVELDRVNYDRDWAFEQGRSLQLDPDSMLVTSNLNRVNWCPSEDDAEFSAGSYGTPGELNTAQCEGAANVFNGFPDDGDDGPRPPRVRDVVITEIMAWAVQTDSTCEWFEIQNLTDDTLDLGGARVSDTGNNLALFPDGVTLGPTEAMVVGRSLDTADNCQTPVDVALTEGFSLNHDVRVIDETTPEADEIFSEMVAQGTAGAGFEMGLYTSWFSFQEPHYTEQNESWLRDDANLALLYVSDEDDISPDPVYWYEDQFAQLKSVESAEGYRLPGRVTALAVVGTEQPATRTEPSCVSDAGAASYGERYVELASQTQGAAESICASDFGPVLENLGLKITGLENRYELSNFPDLEAEFTVLLYESNDYDAPPVQEYERGVDGDYLYDCTSNALRFRDSPPSEFYIVATYTRRPRQLGADCSELDLLAEWGLEPEGEPPDGGGGDGDTGSGDTGGGE